MATDTLSYSLIIMLLVIGIILIHSVFTAKKCENTISYKYLPRTFKEEQQMPVKVGDIFSDMFLKDTTRVRS